MTACALKNMQHSLNGDQQAHFDFIITGDEVSRAKPFPDPYLTAARQLGLNPSSASSWKMRRLELKRQKMPACIAWRSKQLSGRNILQQRTASCTALSICWTSRCCNTASVVRPTDLYISLRGESKPRISRITQIIRGIRGLLFFWTGLLPIQANQISRDF